MSNHNLYSHSTLCFKELLSRVLSSDIIELNCDSLKHLQNEVKRSEKKFSFYSMIPLLKYQPKISTSLIHLIFLILNHFYKAHLGTPSITDNVRMYLFFQNLALIICTCYQIDNLTFSLLNGR